MRKTGEHTRVCAYSTFRLDHERLVRWGLENKKGGGIPASMSFWTGSHLIILKLRSMKSIGRHVRRQQSV